jgi:hypothetical protein
VSVTASANTPTRLQLLPSLTTVLLRRQSREGVEAV